MKLRRTSRTSPGAKVLTTDRRPGWQAAFTLAEALAALAFLAIVIPVSMEALHVANRAGVAALRKSDAARFADRWMNELTATGQWKQGINNGVVVEGNQTFKWRLQNDAWERDAMRRLSLFVTYTVQGREHEIHLATLIDPNSQ